MASTAHLCSSPPFCLACARAAASVVYARAFGQVFPSSARPDLPELIQSFLPEGRSSIPVTIVDLTLEARALSFRAAAPAHSSSASVVVAVLSASLPGRPLSWVAGVFAAPPVAQVASSFSSLLSSSPSHSPALLLDLFQSCGNFPSPASIAALFTSLRGFDVDSASLAAGWFAQDKGRVGKLVELLSGLPNDTSETSDLPGGCDLKTTRIRRCPDTGVPLMCEALALSIMDFDELAGVDFTESRLFRKCQSLALVVTEELGGARLVCGAVHAPLFADSSIAAVAEEDWNELRSLLRSDGPEALSSADGLGKILMTRPKAASSKFLIDGPTRGFYLRPAFSATLVQSLTPL